MITIEACNGTRGQGATVAVACRDLVSASEVFVKLGRATFVPVEEASVEDVRCSGALWASKNGSRHIVALVSEVTEHRTSDQSTPALRQNYA